MQPRDQEALLEEIAALRRETRSLRRWVIFTAVCAGIFLFAPALALFIAACTARIFEALGGRDGLGSVVAGLLVVFCVAAYVVSHFTSSSSSQPRDRGTDEA